jgi:hypothetical protein
MVTSHNYELDNLSITDCKTLDALFLLKDKLKELEPSKPMYIVPVTYTKGWTIDYVETPIDSYENIWVSGSLLKAGNTEELMVFNYKATKDFTEYALVCNGIMYTFSDENKSYFANTFMKGANTSIITYSVNDDVKTKEEMETFRARQEKDIHKTKDNIKAMSKVFNKANIEFAEKKIPLHIKYEVDEEGTYMSPVIRYKDIISDSLVCVIDNELSWAEVYAKRRIFYSLMTRDRLGIVRLSIETRRPNNKDIDIYIGECNLLSSNLTELATVIEILKTLCESYSLDFSLF